MPIMSVGGCSQVSLLMNNTLTAGTRSTAIRNNSYCPTTAPGRIIDLSFVAPSSVTASEPVLPSTPSRFTGPVIELTALTGVAIQRAIDSAASHYATVQSVVYLRPGDYQVASTITIPKNVKIGLMGDHPFWAFTGASRLIWTGTGAGPMLRLEGPSKASISDLHIHGSNSAQGILVDNADQPGGRVFMHQANTGEQYSGYACLVDGLDYTKVEAWDYRLACTDYMTKVIGGPLTAAGQATTSCMNIWGANVMGGGSTTHPFFDVANGGRLLETDNWGESNPRQPYVNLTSASAGSITLQGYKIQYHTAGVGTTPTFIFDGFSGNASVMGMFTNNAVVSIGGSSAEQNVLFAGMSFDHFDVYSSSASVTATQGKSAIINCGYDYFGNQINGGDTAACHGANKPGDCYGHSANNAMPEIGNAVNDTAWLRGMMAQSQSNHPMSDLAPTPDGATDVKLWRVSFGHCNTVIQIKGGPTPVVLDRASRGSTNRPGTTVVKVMPIEGRVVFPEHASKVTLFDYQGRMIAAFPVLSAHDRNMAVEAMATRFARRQMVVRVEIGR